MCPSATGRLRLMLLALSAAGVLAAQPETAPDWRRIGGTTVEIALASPATGPVDAVWFSAEGRLFARTASGRTFEAEDAGGWKPAPEPKGPLDRPQAPTAERLPAAGATVVASGDRLYALATDLYRSEDRGRVWINLTAWERESVIGAGQRDLAVSPRDPEHLVVANRYGVWRSLDGGLSWSGMNQGLPNLPVRRILSTAGLGLRILVEGMGGAEILPGSAREWRKSRDGDPEAEAREQYSRALGAEVTAVAAAAETVYAGAADGRIWVSFDRGRSWTLARDSGGGPVNALHAGAERPSLAWAALGGAGPRLLRTLNSGSFWEDVSANLPEGPAFALAADRAAAAAYLATSAGLFWTNGDLEAGPVSWARVPGLPEARAMDVELSDSGDQLYVALEGYGLYAAPAPHRARILRIVNAADFSSRAAAPGSLVSVLGARVQSARAGGLNFPVLAASAEASQIQVPFGVNGPAVALALDTGTRLVNLALPVKPVSPAIFVSTDHQPMLVDADRGLLLDARNTARSNGRVQVLATGLGRVRPDWPAGLAAPLANPPAVAASVRAYLDRAPIEVTRAVLAPGYVGFYLIELQLPAIVNAGPAELYLTAGGEESNKVSVYLEP